MVAILKSTFVLSLTTLTLVACGKPQPMTELRPSKKESGVKSMNAPQSIDSETSPATPSQPTTVASSGNATAASTDKSLDLAGLVKGIDLNKLSGLTVNTTLPVLGDVRATVDASNALQIVQLVKSASGLVSQVKIAELNVAGLLPELSAQLQSCCAQLPSILGTIIPAAGTAGGLELNINGQTISIDLNALTKAGNADLNKLLDVHSTLVSQVTAALTSGLLSGLTARN